MCNILIFIIDKLLVNLFVNLTRVDSLTRQRTVATQSTATCHMTRVTRVAFCFHSLKLRVVHVEFHRESLIDFICLGSTKNGKRASHSGTHTI